MKLMETIKSVAQSTWHTIDEHSPQILVGTAIVGSIGAIVLACKATIKAADTLDEHKSDVDDINAEYTNNDGNIEDCNERHSKLTKQYLKTGLKLTKHYAPAIILEGLSIASIIASNSIQRKRFAALTAAYSTLNDIFERYRKNVVEKYGEEVDYQMRYGIKEVTEEVTDEKGKTKKVKKTVTDDLSSDFSIFFDDSCAAFHHGCPEYNRAVLRAVQDECNRKLSARCTTGHLGYLYLNEVYQMLGKEPTEAGQVVGWLYDKADGSKYHNFVDFGVFDEPTGTNRRRNGRFLDGLEDVALLDFNIDGTIYGKHAF